MRKSYDAILTRDIEIDIGWISNVALTPDTRLPMRAGRFAFKTARKRDEWVAAINAEHPGAARAAHV